MMDKTPAYNPDPHAHPGLHAIALLEAIKGVLALALSSGLALMGPASLRRMLFALGERLHLRPEHGVLAHLLKTITPGTVHAAALLVLAYACLRFVEAWGLWRVRAWASWLGVVSAALYLPLDIGAIFRHPGWLSVIVLIVNLAVVYALTRDLLRRRRH